jgi:hypothetical protein
MTFFYSSFWDIPMTCPLYEDYTRGCINEFSDVIHIANFDLCESDRYTTDCPFYKYIIESKPQCEFIENCPMYFHVADGDFSALIKMSKEYCFSPNFSQCARYNLRKEHKTVPKNLYPNGNIKNVEE